MSSADLKDLPLPLGSMLFKYQLESVIGRGGYAWVYRGHDTCIGRDVAIKILHREQSILSLSQAYLEAARTAIGLSTTDQPRN